MWVVGVGGVCVWVGGRDLKPHTPPPPPPRRGGVGGDASPVWGGFAGPMHDVEVIFI